MSRRPAFLQCTEVDSHGSLVRPMGLAVVLLIWAAGGMSAGQVRDDFAVQLTENARCYYLGIPAELKRAESRYSPRIVEVPVVLLKSAEVSNAGAIRRLAEEASAPCSHSAAVLPIGP